MKKLEVNDYGFAHLTLILLLHYLVKRRSRNVAVACQKLLKSANVSRSYSKNNTGTVFWRHGVQVIK